MAQISSDTSVFLVGCIGCGFRGWGHCTRTCRLSLRVLTVSVSIYKLCDNPFSSNLKYGDAIMTQIYKCIDCGDVTAYAKCCHSCFTIQKFAYRGHIWRGVILKAKNCRDINFVVTGGIGGCTGAANDDIVNVTAILGDTKAINTELPKTHTSSSYSGRARTLQSLPHKRGPCQH